MSLQDIIFEDINQEFAWGQYGQLAKVVIHKGDTYVNCTQILKNLNYDEKQLNEKTISRWKNRNISAKEMFIRLAADNNIEEENCKFHISNHKYKMVKGSYLHPDLVPHYLSWVSPEIGLYVGKIVSKFLSREQLETINKQKQEIGQLKTKHDELIEKLDRAHEESMEARKSHREAMQKADEERERNRELLEQIHELNKKLHNKADQLITTQNTLVKRTDLLIDKADRSVIRSKKKAEQEHLVIMHNPASRKYKYYAICRQHNTVTEAQKPLKIKRYEEIFRITDAANSKKFLRYIKNEINLDADNRYFNINLTPDQLEDKFKSLYAKYRFDGVDDEIL
jgi:hypothetical protein